MTTILVNENTPLQDVLELCLKIRQVVIRETGLLRTSTANCKVEKQKLRHFLGFLLSRIYFDKVIFSLQQKKCLETTVSMTGSYQNDHLRFVIYRKRQEDVVSLQKSLFLNLDSLSNKRLNLTSNSTMFYTVDDVNTWLQFCLSIWHISGHQALMG